MQEVVLVVGEALVDVVQRSDGSVEEFAGGSAANVAVALSRLERPVRFATAFTADRYGEILSRHLATSGVILASDPSAIDRTASAVATIAADGSASYEFDIEWRLNQPGIDDIDLVVVHTSSIAAVLAPGCDDVARLLADVRGRAIVSYDVNARPSITGTGPEVVAAVERIAALSDVVKASDEDLDALYPGLSLEEAARVLLATGPAAVLVTRGGEGALWVAKNTSGEVPSMKVTVADTIGAGDTFGAATIDALWSRRLVGAAARERLADLPADEWREIVAYAASVAAITVSRPGADPPHRHELG